MKQPAIKHVLSILLLLGILLVWAAPGHAQSEDAAVVGFFTDYEIPSGTRVEVPLEVRNAEELYAVDVTIQFDPDILSAEDANPEKQGIQPALGTFLDAGLTLFNEVNNETGIVRFVMTQTNPSEPKSGEGVLLVLYFSGLQDGESAITVTTLELANRFGEAVPSEPANSTILVSAGAAVKESTPIPVQAPAEMIDIPTPEPTTIPPTPTQGIDQAEDTDPNSVPTPAGETALENDDTAEDNGAAGQPSDENDKNADAVETDGVSQAEKRVTLLDYWWVVLIVVVLVIGMGIYLFATKK